MKSKSKFAAANAVAFCALFLSGCGQNASGDPPATPDAGFAAAVAGAVSGRISGDGVLHFIENDGPNGEGYYFIADGQGLRDYGVTFTLPAGTQAERYVLESPHPLDYGSVASVRVDHDVGDRTLSWDQNTTGMLNLSAFPQGGDGRVEGDFEFQTENANGDRVRVTGSFSFDAKIETTRVPSSMTE